MLTIRRLFLLNVILLILSCGEAQSDLPDEKPLWPYGVSDAIQYPQGEKTRSPKASSTSPSAQNRVFTDIDTPSYTIHRPSAEKVNGVGLVICPGGGYTDVWLDREGHDLAIWLKQHGVTSLVLKYRTNGKAGVTGRKYEWDEYIPEVVADGRQAVRTLRGSAKSLGLKPDRIGICGFSAGGNLAMQVALLTNEKAESTASPISSQPDFAGLFYPWVRTNAYQSMAPERVPPTFIMNAADDRVTPARRCIDLYAKLLDLGAKPELHIVRKGGHGFDLGEGRGQSTAMWKQAFVAWLQDAGLTD